MTPDDYLKNRVDDQISWYDSKSAENKKKYHLRKMITIFLSALIPIASQLPINADYRLFLMAIMGALVSILASLEGVYKYQENWLKYRTTTESLKHHKMLYLTKSGEYNIDSNEESFKQFVIDIEKLISVENSNWAEFNSGDLTKVNS